jgi:hypothetical protein
MVAKTPRPRPLSNRLLRSASEPTPTSSSARKGVRRAGRDAAAAFWRRVLIIAAAAVVLAFSAHAAVRIVRGAEVNWGRIGRLRRAHVKAREGGVADLKELLEDIVPGAVPEGIKGVDRELILLDGSRRKSVTVLAVNYAYRELAMNLVCNLKRLGMENYLILAMDRPVYKYVARRRANVFLHTGSRSGPEDEGIPPLLPADDTEEREGDDEDRGHVFGSLEFAVTSRRKSMLVAEVLVLGYDVMFTDADVIWYKDPAETLATYAEDFAIMSDAHTTNYSMPLNYNINSGCYYARGRPRTFVALRAIQKYAAKSRRSEQKGFNHVLCGAFKDNIAGPGWRFGRNRCLYRIMGGVTTRALPSNEFANGSDELIFRMSPTQIASNYPHLVALHVNYVNGRDEKVYRFKRIGQWHYDSEAGEGFDGCLAKPFPDYINSDAPKNGRQSAEEVLDVDGRVPPVQDADDQVIDDDSDDGGMTEEQRQEWRNHLPQIETQRRVQQPDQ